MHVQSYTNFNFHAFSYFAIKIYLHLLKHKRSFINIQTFANITVFCYNKDDTFRVEDKACSSP